MADLDTFRVASGPRSVAHEIDVGLRGPRELPLLLTLFIIATVDEKVIIEAQDVGL